MSKPLWSILGVAVALGIVAAAWTLHPLVGVGAAYFIYNAWQKEQDSRREYAVQAEYASRKAKFLADRLERLDRQHQRGEAGRYGLMAETGGTRVHPRTRDGRHPKCAGCEQLDVREFQEREAARAAMWERLAADAERYRQTRSPRPS